MRPRRPHPSSPAEAGHASNDLEVVHVTPLKAPVKVDWHLPASKSHAIRWLLMGALSRSPTVMHGISGLGEDAQSMRRVLVQLGLRVEDADDAWRLQPPAMLRRPSSALDLGNSGTALRLIAGAVSHLEGPVVLDGDDSLRRRGLGDLASVLEQRGVQLRVADAHAKLPVDLHGPWSDASEPVVLRRDRSSQPASAMLLASSLQSHDVQVRFEGPPRSSRHLALSASIAEACGWPGQISAEGMHLPCWDLHAPSEVRLPGDASMAAFALLWVRSTGGSVTLKRWPGPADALGCELLEGLAAKLGVAWSKDGALNPAEYESKPLSVDLCDANDLLPPLAALLALGPGGRIHGAPHAVHKESNRILSTIEVLGSFGLDAEATDDGVVVQGGQRPAAPERPVQASEDHRLMMTGMCLAASVGGAIVGPRLHRVADPGFLARLSETGLITEVRTVSP